MDFEDIYKTQKLKPINTSDSTKKSNPSQPENEKIGEILNPIVSKLEKKLEQTDLVSRKPPFIPNLFYIWRFEAYKDLETIISKFPFSESQKFKKSFADVIDGKYLAIFEEKMNQPYFDLVYRENYNMPVKISEKDLEENKFLYSELRSLSESISKWCILIEKCSDAIERAILYGLAIQDENSIFYEQLKQDKNYHKSFSLTGYTRSLLNKSILYSLDSISSMVFSKGFTNISVSWATSMAVLYWVVGGAAFPWGCVLGRVQIPWLLGGIIGSKAIQKVSSCLKGKYKQNDLKELERMFSNINLKLDEFYFTINAKITNCLEEPDERNLQIKKDDIQYYINAFLSEKYSGEISDDELSKLGIERLDIKEEDGWIIVDPKVNEIREEELDNGFTKIDFI